jgi:protein-L-isoaspartate(D-aspartate) O-methyltransferase
MLLYLVSHTNSSHKKVGSTGKVVGVEHIKELVESSIRNVNKNHPEWIENGQVELVEGDGRLGYPQEAPFDCM